MSKKVYCSYCGRELEKGLCDCDGFLNAKIAMKSRKQKNNSMPKKICDTCGSKIDADALYCPYCGLPTNVNNNLSDLQKELRGENAPDVIEIYKEDLKKARKKNNSIPLSFLFLLSITMFAIGVVFGYTILPSIRKFASDIRLMMSLSNADENIESSSITENTSTETATITDDNKNEPHDKIIEEENENLDDTKSPTAATQPATTQPVKNTDDEKDKENKKETEDIKETESTEPEYRNEWVVKDGKTYAYDLNGNMIKNKWVEKLNDKGENDKYYFTKDGYLATDTWIDLTYYVGSDGAMYRSTQTPDGDYVDKDGKITEEESDVVPVNTNTQIQYSEPNSNSQIVSNNQTSAITGRITGVDKTKSYALYVERITRVTEKVQSGSSSCNLIYYVPVFNGAKEEEVKKVNEAFSYAFKTTFDNLIKEQILSQATLPKSVVFDEVKQQQVNANKIQINIYGKMTFEGSLNSKPKYRFIYDRKAEEMTRVGLMPE